MIQQNQANARNFLWEVMRNLMFTTVGGIIVAKSYRTPSKMRILAGAVHSQRQQIVRIVRTDGRPQS